MNLDSQDIIKDEIDLYGLFKNIWTYKLFIISITSIAAIISIVYSLSLNNTYTSFAILAPGDSNQSSLSQYSGLAGMAGISLPSESNQTTEAIGRVNSYDFFVTSIVPAIKIEDLMAVKMGFR